MSVSSPSAELEADPEIGQEVDGRYRIVALLGRGGMGSVYRAEHLAMGKAVALKLLHPQLGGKRDAGARFQREAFVGGRLDHPNCVAVSDFGVRDDGSFYLVMELLSGESLGDVIDREHRLPWPRALHIARHVLRGLGHAHNQGVVHRDIKPDNIFVARHDDDPDFAKILDFGIAKLIAGDGADANITRAGVAIGTPSYLSPEQAFGGQIDGGTDLYSLSVVLFELLTGRPPFLSDDPLELLSAHGTAEVPRFAAIAPELDIPAEIEALVRDGLAKRRIDRIASAEEYVARIDELRGRLMGSVVPTRAGSPLASQLVSPFERSGPISAALGIAPTRAMPTPMHSVSLTSPMLTRPWYRRAPAIAVMVVLGVGVVAALASRDEPAGASKAPAVAPVTPAGTVAPGKPDASKPAPAPAGKAGKPGKGKAAAAPVARPDDDAEPVTSPDAVDDPVIVPDDGAAPAGAAEPAAVPPTDDAFKAAIRELITAKTCPKRKAAVATLRALGDPRAVPALKKARYRMRGGVLGFGEENSNGCLKADAEAAAAELAAKAAPPATP